MKNLEVTVKNKKIYPVYLENDHFIGYVYFDKGGWNYQCGASRSCGYSYDNTKNDAIISLIVATCKHCYDEQIEESLIELNCGEFILDSSERNTVSFVSRYDKVIIKDN